MRNSKNAQLVERARQVIPNGMYGHESVALLPAGYPQFLSRGEGAKIWDVDGNEYIDFMCAYGPNLLGYGHPSIKAAMDRQSELGDTLTGPSEVMVELAEAFTGMVSHADWAMFCKNGSDATSMALLIARAYRGRRKILMAKGTYHGAHAWNTPVTTGVLPEDRAHIVYFEYNDLDSLRAAMQAHAGDIAGVFFTPFRHEVFQDQYLPTQEFAHGARELCNEHDALLIVDDIRAGFRLTRDCSWSLLGVEPDLSAWGKVLGNGQPLSALLGSEKARVAAGSIYATGSFWFSAVPMAAGLETLRLIRETDYLEQMIDKAERLRAGMTKQAEQHGLSIRHTGPAQMPQVLFDEDPDFARGYFWTAQALEQGVYLSPYHNMFVTSALTEADIEKTLNGTDAAFAALKAELPRLKPQQNEFLAKRLTARATA